MSLDSVEGSPGGFEIVVHEDLADVTVIAVFGELDLATCPLLDAQIRRAEGLTASVVVDMGGLEFMDSTGIHVLLSGYQRARDEGRGFSLRRGSAAVQRVIELTGLGDILPFED